VKSFVVYANCQSGALAKTLLENHMFSENYTWDFIEPIQNLGAKDIDEVIRKVKAADLFIYQPIAVTSFRPRELSSDFLLSKLKKKALSISFSSLYFDGYFPHLQVLKKSVAILNLVHDYIVAYCSVLKLNKARTIDLINSCDLYPKELSIMLAEKSLQNLKEREKKFNIDIVLSDFIFNNYRKTKLFNQFNHPTRPVFLYLANIIFSIINCPSHDTSSGAEYLDRIMTPIYKSTHFNLELEFEENFTCYNATIGRGISQEIIIENLLDFYGHLEPESSDNRKLTIRDHRILTTLRRVCCSGRSEGDRPASANW
jgi:hypothetical protein